MLGTTTDLIVAFAPQIMLYGVSVVLTGLLQAYRKFTGPTLAPVIGNLVTITALPDLRLARQRTSRWPGRRWRPSWCSRSAPR